MKQILGFPKALNGKLRFCLFHFTVDYNLKEKRLLVLTKIDMDIYPL